MSPQGAPVALPIPASQTVTQPITESREISNHLTEDKSIEYEKRQVAIRLLQTTSKLITGILGYSFGGIKPIFFKLLPIFAINESSEFEPNLARDCKIVL